MLSTWEIYRTSSVIFNEVKIRTSINAVEGENRQRRKTCEKSWGSKNPKISLQLVFPGTLFNYSCLIRLSIMQKAGQNLKEGGVLARSSLSSGAAAHFHLTNPSSWNAFDDGVLGRFLLYNQLIASWYLPASPLLVQVEQNSWEKKTKPAKCTLYLGVIRSQNTDSEIGSLVHQLIVNNIKPFPIKLSPVAGKLHIIAVNVFSCVSKKNHVCYRSATYKCLCTSICS